MRSILRNNRALSETAEQASSTIEPKLDDKSSERGYVMVMTALLLIPLMVFAAFAVDVGAWYAQAARTQRAADAAALAAVVWMPDEVKATEAALDVAARNGFVEGANATIIVERVGNQEVKVSIESAGEVYFGAPVLDSIDIERFAVAEYILPVPMGNPTSALGTGNLDGAGDGIWLSVNGICWPRQHGDPFSTRSIEPGGGNYNDCGGSSTYAGTANPVYDGEGYVYVIDVPEGSGDVNVQFFEPGICANSAIADAFDLETPWGGPWVSDGPGLDIRLYAADDTPLSDQDNLDAPPVASIQFDRDDCDAGMAGDTHWYQAVTVPGGNPGRWFMRVRVLSHEITGDTDDRVGGMNSYSIRLARGADTTICSSLVDAMCPQVFAKDWLSLYRPPIGLGPSSFFLAEIDAVHAGKTVEVVMFDPGEGMHDLQILSPDGTAMPFEYQENDCVTLVTNCPNPPLQPHDGSCGGTPCLDVTGSIYNGHSLRILVDLPAGYDCDGEPHCWWKIRYDPGGGDRAPTDRTTWSVRVIGDPVRLTE